MSDEEEDRVEAMSPQEVMDHQRRVQARQRTDPPDFLIERECERVSDKNTNNAAGNDKCTICQEVYSGSCFLLRACNHFFYRDCVNDLFDHCPTDKHVICPLCKGQ